MRAGSEEELRRERGVFEPSLGVSHFLGHERMPDAGQEGEEQRRTVAAEFSAACRVWFGWRSHGRGCEM